MRPEVRCWIAIAPSQQPKIWSALTPKPERREKTRKMAGPRDEKLSSNAPGVRREVFGGAPSIAVMRSPKNEFEFELDFR